ncbi:MAG: hypothetical protein KDA84_21930 [Planctomycetaceae bacterium]|nr:hypothetical protein [Planctomycetaceae bacterium]
MSIHRLSLCLTVCVACVLTSTTFVHADECEEEKERECRTPYRIFGHKAEIDSREVAPLTMYERHARAGHPQCISPIADWSNTSRYWGYNVGGGNAWKFGPLAGERRYTQCEGTWGWDYVPWWSNVRLRWWHGRRYQDGEGQYQANSKVEPFSPKHGPKGIIMDGLIH